MDDVAPELKQAMERVLGDKRRLALEITRQEIGFLAAAIQLACRHPAFPQSSTLQWSRRWMTKVIDAVFADDDEARAALALGWDPKHDVEVRR